MRKASITLIVLATVVTVGCQQKVEIRKEESMEVNVEAEKTEIKALLENYVRSVEDEDIDLYAQSVAHNTDMVNFGAFGDPIVGWVALKKVMDDQNAALSQTKIGTNDLAIHLCESGKLAWATCLWDFKAVMGENPVQLPVRCTWAFEKREKGWVVAHFHKSIAAK